MAPTYRTRTALVIIFLITIFMPYLLPSRFLHAHPQKRKRSHGRRSTGLPTLARAMASSTLARAMAAACQISPTRALALGIDCLFRAHTCSLASSTR